ncbi:hypothetical protein TruAng_012141 [Truncatella angustata]|nr:hypothetical protein TruAng_012141 [Truncatella angustata]
MVPLSASSSALLERTATNFDDLARHVAASANDLASTAVYLTPVQEEYFINMFWETYHTSFVPIVDERQFKKHYQSLWVRSSNFRKPSALVDIILAMCMQVGISALPSERQGAIAENNDATIAGRWHYRRAQMLLSLESESPTIATLQCHLLCIAYLCGGSFHNMVDIACALSVRTAHALGLHLEAPGTISEQERQMRRRLWWAVYLVDSKIGMKLGRPFLLSDHHVMPDLPGDDLDAAVGSGSTFAPIGMNTTWLSFNLQQTKLYQNVRTAHVSFYAKEPVLDDGQMLWDNAHALEDYAQCLSPHTRDLDGWAAEVPMALRVNRKNGGLTLSTDGTELDLEQFAPMWLQRQRVLLELTYHHLCVDLYRPLISLTTVSTVGLLTEGVGAKCAAHAIALSKITHQVLSSTSILNGWHEAFQWQWSAAMTLIGFLVSYPHGSLARSAREAVDLAIAVFDIFGVGFVVAANAAKIARELIIRVDSLTDAKIQNDAFGNRGTTNNTTVAMDMAMIESQAMTNSASWTDRAFDFNDIQTNNEGFGTDLFDMVLDVDFWADLDVLWPN